VNEACGSRTTVAPLNLVAPPYAGIAEEGLSLCRGEEVDLSSFLIGEDANGQWTDSGGQDVEPILTVNTIGTNVFSYTVPSQACDPSITELQIEVSEGPNAGEPNNPVQVCEGDDAFNLIALMPGATPGGTWTNEAGNPAESFYDPMISGTYTFLYTVTNPACGFISSELTLDVSDNHCIEEEVIIPQGFSPNGDGRGDTWDISGLLMHPNNSLIVYNRWGAQVYSARPVPFSGWDGKPSEGGNLNEILPIGTYYYILDLGDGSEPKSGYVYLNR